MSYTLLTDEEFYKQEKQDKLDLDLFRKVVNQSCKKMHLIYKLLDKGANPMRFDGEIIKLALTQTGFSHNYLEFVNHCYENYQDVKDYIHKDFDLKIALAMPVYHINALLFIINHTERNLTKEDRQRLNKGPENLRVGNEHAIQEINQALEKRDLRDKLLVKSRAMPKRTTTKKMKI